MVCRIVIWCRQVIFHHDISDPFLRLEWATESHLVQGMKWPVPAWKDLYPQKIHFVLQAQFLGHGFALLFLTWKMYCIVVVQLLSHVQLFVTPMDCSTPGFPVLFSLPEFAQSHVPWVSDTIQLSHPLSPPSSPSLNLSQHQGLIQWFGSSHQVAKVLELQLKFKCLPARQKVHFEGIGLGMSFQTWEKFSPQSALVLLAFLLLHPSSLHSCSAFGNDFSESYKHRGLPPKKGSHKRMENSRFGNHKCDLQYV